jgi:hypothetical protein
MESITLLFVTGLLAAGLFVTLLVRRDIVSRRELERERQRQSWRRAGAGRPLRRD